MWYNTNWVCGIPENMSKVGQKMCVVDFKIFVFVEQKRRFCLTQNDLWLTIKLGCGFWPKTGCLFDPEGVCVLFALKKGYWKYVCGQPSNMFVVDNKIEVIFNNTLGLCLPKNFEVVPYKNWVWWNTKCVCGRTQNLCLVGWL